MKTCDRTLEPLRTVAPTEVVEEPFGDHFVYHGEVPRAERLLVGRRALRRFSAATARCSSSGLRFLRLRIAQKKTTISANSIAQLTSSSGPMPAAVPPNGPSRGHTHPAFAAMVEV